MDKPVIKTGFPEIRQEQSRHNLFWIDILRVVVMIGVINIHVAADVITEWGKVPASWWWAANLYDSLVRGCVPVFIMISGALLLGKQESYGDFFSKRFQRIAIPFIFWISLYLIWKKIFYLPEMTLFQALSAAAVDRVHFHLWFLYIIIGLYLITPILRVVTQYASRRDLIFFLFLWFLVSSGLPFLEKTSALFLGAALKISLPIPPAQGFIGYFLLGHFIHRYAKTSWFKPALLLWILSFLICFWGTGALSANAHRYQNLLYDNFAPNVVIFTASFFVLIKQAGPVVEKMLSAPKVRSLVLSLSSASFGIYLLHPMILDALIKGRWGFTLTGNAEHPVFMIPFVVVPVYLLSFIIVRLIEKIPALKRVV